MQKNWGSWGTCQLGSIPNYIEFIRDWEDDWSDIYEGEYEESFEVDENEEEDGLNSDSEVEN